MDRIEAAVGDLVRSTAEAQLQAAEDSVAGLVRQEIAALAAARLGGVNCANFPTPWVNGRAPAMDDSQRTIWDAVIIVGLPNVGATDTIIIFLGLVSTISIQTFICNAIGNGFVWKMSARQDFKNMFEVAAALRAETCHSVGSSNTCFHSTNTPHDTVQQRAASVDGITLFVCLTAVLCWALLVVRELWHTLQWTRSMWTLPRKPTQVVYSGNRFVLMSIGHMRLLLAIVIGMVRVGIALALLDMGFRHLAKVKSPPIMMILVAVLGFALDVPRRAASQFLAAQSFNRSLRRKKCL